MQAPLLVPTVQQDTHVPQCPLVQRTISLPQVHIVTQVPLLVPTVQQDTSVPQGLLVQHKMIALGVNTALQERARLSRVEHDTSVEIDPLVKQYALRVDTALQEQKNRLCVPEINTARQEFLGIRLVLLAKYLIWVQDLRRHVIHHCKSISIKIVSSDTS
jgi:hypothetical protein